MKYILILALMLTGCSTPQHSKRIYNNSAMSAGTAFNVKYKNKVYGVTAGHLCYKSGTGTLYLGEKQNTEIKILATDHVLDLCLLEPLPNLEPRNLYTGVDAPTTISVYGYPGKSAVEKVTTGVVGGVHVFLGEILPNDEGACPPGTNYASINEEGDLPCEGAIIRATTDARAYPGCSGGPITNESDAVVGVVHAIGIPDGVPTFFVPSFLLKDYIDSYSAYK